MSGPGGCFLEDIARMLLLYFLIVKCQLCLCQLKMNCFAWVIAWERQKSYGCWKCEAVDVRRSWGLEASCSCICRYSCNYLCCVAFKTYDFVACRGHTLVQLMIAIPAIEERTTWLSICIFFSTKKTVAMKFLFKVTCMTRIGCGMVFRFASKLQKHEKSHSVLLCF